MPLSAAILDLSDSQSRQKSGLTEVILQEELINGAHFETDKFDLLRKGYKEKRVYWLNNLPVFADQ